MLVEQCIFNFITCWNLWVVILQVFILEMLYPNAAFADSLLYVPSTIIALSCLLISLLTYEIVMH